MISGENCWCHHNPGDVLCDFYIFWIFFRKGIKKIPIGPRFTIVGYVWQILETGPFRLPQSVSTLKRPIPNRVKPDYFSFEITFVMIINFYLCFSSLRWSEWSVYLLKNVLIYCIYFHWRKDCILNLLNHAWRMVKF